MALKRQLGDILNSALIKMWVVVALLRTSTDSIYCSVCCHGSTSRSTGLVRQCVVSIFFSARKCADVRFRDLIWNPAASPSSPAAGIAQY